MEKVYSNKKRRSFTFLIISTCLLSSIFLIGLNKKENDTYKYPDCNVILISIDSLRPDHLGCYRYHRNTSPHIDTIAQNSIIFENAFTHIPVTDPCLMTMLTSVYPSVHSINQPIVLNNNKVQTRRLSDSLVTLPQVLKKSGYTTSAFVNIDGTTGFDKGFDTYEQIEVLQWIVVAKYNDKNFFVESELFKWIEKNQDNKFFLFSHTYATHSPYISPDYTLYIDTYNGNIPSTYDEWKNMRTDSFDYFSTVNESDKNDIQHLINLYDGCISYTDRQLGLLFRKLEELNLLRKTIIILMADHGEEFHEHGGLTHGDLYIEHMHIPLIIKLPDNRAKRITCNVGLIDLVPTILDLLDIKFKPKKYKFQGISLIPVIKEKVLTHDIYAEKIEDEHNLCLCALRTKQWKYIENKDTNYSALFNITSDPQEKHNVLSDYPRIAHAMHQKIKSFQNKNQKLKSKIKESVVNIIFDEETVERLRSLGYVK